MAIFCTDELVVNGDYGCMLIKDVPMVYEAPPTVKQEVQSLGQWVLLVLLFYTVSVALSTKLRVFSFSCFNQFTIAVTSGYTYKNLRKSYSSNIDIMICHVTWMIFLPDSDLMLLCRLYVGVVDSVVRAINNCLLIQLDWFYCFWGTLNMQISCSHIISFNSSVMLPLRR